MEIKFITDENTESGNNLYDSKLLPVLILSEIFFRNRSPIISEINFGICRNI